MLILFDSSEISVSPLACLLIKRALSSQELALYLYWYLKVRFFAGNLLYCSNSFLKCKHLQVELTDEKSGRLFQVKIFTLVKDLKLVLIRNRYV